MATSYLKQEDRGRKNRSFAKKEEGKKDTLFADILGAQTVKAPTQFSTVVYNPRGRLVETQYQTREWKM